MKNNNELYEIYIDDDCIARYISLQFALILIKAIYVEFYAEPELKITIKKYNPNTISGEEVKE